MVFIDTAGLDEFLEDDAKMEVNLKDLLKDNKNIRLVLFFIKKSAELS
jgi:predicted GTPase